MRLTMSLLLSLWLVGCSDDTQKATDIGTKLDQNKPAAEKGIGDVSIKTEAKPNTDGKVACQTSQKVLAFAPAPGGAIGWADNTALWGATGAGPHDAYTDADIEALPIDGHNMPFQGKNKGFVMEYYLKGTSVLTFYLWDMKTAADAQAVYKTQKVDTDEVKNKIVFTDIPNAPEVSVIGAASNYWKVWGYKCNYLYEITQACVNISGDPSNIVCDKTQLDTVKPDVIAFVQAFVKGLP
jgi:hypothetical protein